MWTNPNYYYFHSNMLLSLPPAYIRENKIIFPTWHPCNTFISKLQSNWQGFIKQNTPRFLLRYRFPFKMLFVSCRWLRHRERKSLFASLLLPKAFILSALFCISLGWEWRSRDSSTGKTDVTALESYSFNICQGPPD